MKDFRFSLIVLQKAANVMTLARQSNHTAKPMNTTQQESGKRVISKFVLYKILNQRTFSRLNLHKVEYFVQIIFHQSV